MAVCSVLPKVRMLISDRRYAENSDVLTYMDPIYAVGIGILLQGANDSNYSPSLNQAALDVIIACVCVPFCCVRYSVSRSNRQIVEKS